MSHVNLYKKEYIMKNPCVTSRWLPLAAVLALAGCGGGSDNEPGLTSDNTGLPEGMVEKTLPAASDEVYVNLETGELVDPSDTWHLKASRLTFNLNGGESGTGNVGGALAVAQDDFYKDNGDPDENVFTNASASSELEHLLGPFEAPAAWQTDGLQSAFGSWETWSSYDYSTGQISALSDIGYLVRSAEGNSFARMKVVSFDFPTRANQGIRDFEFEFSVQGAGEAAFSDQPVTFTPPADYDGGDACFDFDSGQVVDCDTSDTWDVMVGFSGYNWYLRSNSGPSGSGDGGASGPIGWDELDSYEADPGVPQIYAQDSTGGVFSEHTWYAYNLLGNHKIWPNFRTYLIKADIDETEASVWALQIVNYYDDDGVSGNPTIRWHRVTLN